MNSEANLYYFYFQTMLSRFATTSAIEKEEKIKGMHAINTLKSDKKAARTVRAYLCEQNKPAEFEQFPNTELNNMLSHMYFDLRKIDGDFYKCTSLVNFRHSLNRYLKSIHCQRQRLHRSKQELSSSACGAETEW